MGFPEAEEVLGRILEQEQQDQAYRLWLHSSKAESFAEFWEKVKPRKPEPVRASADILAETDELFKGR